jgi:peroxiredoxin
MRLKAIVFLAAAAAAATVAVALQGGQGAPSLVGQPAPNFTATGTDGKTYNLASVEKKAPLIMVFWKNPCPHNPRASSLVNSIVDAYKGKVNFVGVVNADGDSAKSFQQQFGKDYVFLQDGSKSIIGSYQQRRSIAFVVVNKDKKVEAVIGGYSQDAMAQLNAAMAKAAGMEEAKLDFSGAPTRTTYG